MIKEHPFTTLCDLLRDPSQEVMNIFNANVQKPQSPSGRPLYEMTLSTIPTNRDGAERKINQLQSMISRCGDNIEVFKAVNRVLTTEGMGRLISLVINNLPKDEFLNNNIQNLFTGMPIFKIKVEENGIPYWRQDKTVGKYDIKFVHTGSTDNEDPMPITFKTTAAKALFLLFLLIPRIEIYDIFKIKPVFAEIIENSFDYNMDIFDSIEKDFKKLIRTNKPYTNSDIKAVLNGRDDENWYIIDYDHSKGYYSLSLPEGKIDISKCPELLKYKKELLSTLK